MASALAWGALMSGGVRADSFHAVPELAGPDTPSPVGASVERGPTSPATVLLDRGARWGVASWSGPRGTGITSQAAAVVIAGVQLGVGRVGTTFYDETRTSLGWRPRGRGFGLVVDGRRQRAGEDARHGAGVGAHWRARIGRVSVLLTQPAVPVTGAHALYPDRWRAEARVSERGWFTEIGLASERDAATALITRIGAGGERLAWSVRVDLSSAVVTLRVDLAEPVVVSVGSAVHLELGVTSGLQVIGGGP